MSGPTADRARRDRPFRQTLLDAVAGGVAGGLLAGAGIAHLTLRLNPALEAVGERVLLVVELAVLYGVLGAALGALAALALAAARRLGAGGRTARLLPRLRLSPHRLAALGLALAVTVVAAVAAIAILRPGTAATAAAVLAAGGDPAGPIPAGQTPEAPPPVVLLMIDGADLDDVILPLVEAGELPAFARLIRGGAWGTLATLEPTLSPRIWTTVATGKAPESHGIEDFVHFRLPGIDAPIARFPRHSGLNYQLFPWLEALPGFRRAPYTSEHRRVRALWEIAGERFAVGVYRWLVTWPAAPVSGFMVAAGNVAGAEGWHPESRRWLRRMRHRQPGVVERLATYPPDLVLPSPAERRPARRTLAAYLAPGHPLDRSHPGVRAIAGSLREATLDQLPALMRDHRPRFTAAAFYPVDRFQHQFSRDRLEGGPFAPAIAERYRFTDRMLGRFQKTLPPDVQLLVISDHGFDFEEHHHRQAPPGLFLARGPAFPRGRRVTGLSVGDVAPLCLHLLGLPLPDDMPGARGGAFRLALAGADLDGSPAGRIATYERGPRPPRRLDVGLDAELEADLKSLGYLQ